MKSSNMTKPEFVKAVATRADLTLPRAEEVLRIFTEAVGQALKGGDYVRFMGFGTFKVVKVAARKGVSPQTLLPMDIPARSMVKFVASDDFKRELNK